MFALIHIVQIQTIAQEAEKSPNLLCQAVSLSCRIAGLVLAIRLDQYELEF